MHVDALIEFLAGLERNNDRPWFAWNKPAYDILREEFLELVADDDALSRPPKGFAADLPHIDAIRRRHFFAIVETDLVRHPSKDLAADLAGHFRDLLPLMRWLRGAVAGAGQ